MRSFIEHREIATTSGEFNFSRTHRQCHIDLGVQRNDLWEPVRLRLRIRRVGHELVRRRGEYSGQNHDRSFRRHSHTGLEMRQGGPAHCQTVSQLLLRPPAFHSEPGDPVTERRQSGTQCHDQHDRARPFKISAIPAISVG